LRFLLSIPRVFHVSDVNHIPAILYWPEGEVVLLTSAHRNRKYDCFPAAGKRRANRDQGWCSVMDNRHQLKFRWLPGGPYAIVRLAPDVPVPDWATRGIFTSISRTAEEISVVCPADNLPADVHSPHHWINLKLEGPFPFSQTGILLSFIEPLASNGIPIFAISTYDTDYVLIMKEYAGTAIDALRDAGHELIC